MARRTGTSRVSGSGGGPSSERREPEFPSMRKRRPFMYWIVVLAVAAMVLGTIASFALAL